MGQKLAVVVVEGPHANFDAVRRALLLPRKPDRMLTFEEASGSEYDEDHLALWARPGQVVVFGWSVLWLDDICARLSQGGRVVRVSLAENFSGNSFDLFSDGTSVRRLGESEEGDSTWLEEGPRSGLERSAPPTSPDAHPFDHVSAILANLLGKDPFDLFWALDNDGEPHLAAWKVSAT